MNWKKKLSEIESSFENKNKRDWRLAIELTESLMSEYPDNVEVNIRGIYLMHNILVEEEYPDIEHNYIAALLKKHFEQSNQKFSKNPEYLFFIGKILHIAEWYFGLDDDLKPLKEKLAFKMQKKAFEMEPTNLLYEWAFIFSKDEKKQAFNLSERILYKQSHWLTWLKTKGFPGIYMIESLKYCYENYKQLT